MAEHVFDDGLDRQAHETRAEGSSRILDRIHSPSDTRGLDLEGLETLAQEIRAYLVQTASDKGGHFAPSLGTVELTLALHYVFNTPHDRIVWDVGHQAYTHKILTGRKERMPTIRQYGGLSGFLKRTESEYDCFGAGHASTAPSAAAGMAVARDLKKEDRNIIAVIGDGALTGGLAFEALNNLGAAGHDILVILNDNAMSISPNVGAVAHYLTAVTAHPYYRKMKRDVHTVLEKMPRALLSMAEFANRLEQGIKGALVPGALFQALGFSYQGPIDGHDLAELTSVLGMIRDGVKGPILLHVLTQKGKGYSFAEADPVKWHGVTPFDAATGSKRASSVPVSDTPSVSYTKVFSDAMIDLAERKPELVAITAAMSTGTGLEAFQERYPDRFFDVGIAEGHGVTFAAGLAAEGIRPVCAIYSTFLQRAVDHIMHDAALQHLPVIFAMDRGGLVGADGPTHHGVFDLVYLRMLPDVIVSAPKDADELADLLETAIDQDSRPFALRYPRGNAPQARTREPRILPIGSWEMLEDGGTDVALLAVGSMVPVAGTVAKVLRDEGIGVRVVNCRFIKPLDLEMLTRIGRESRLLVTLEEGALAGGFGSAVHEAGEQGGLGISDRLRHCGLPDKWVAHGTQDELLREVGLDSQTIVRRTKAWLEALRSSPDEI